MVVFDAVVASGLSQVQRDFLAAIGLLRQTARPGQPCFLHEEQKVEILPDRLGDTTANLRL